MSAHAHVSYECQSDINQTHVNQTHVSYECQSDIRVKQILLTRHATDKLTCLKAGNPTCLKADASQKQVI